MDQGDIPSLLSRLASDEDGVRKIAIFKLQSSINDPGFADVFISSGGLVVLRRLVLSATGNTLAYSLQSLTRLLEVDMGWELFYGPAAVDMVERMVQLVVTNPLVNILRGAMSILVAVVSYLPTAGSGGPNPSPSSGPAPQVLPNLGLGPSARLFGFRAIKPAIAVYPKFFELVIQQLRSADHALCANSLMLINALIRDTIYGDPPVLAATSLTTVSPMAPAPVAAPGAVPTSTQPGEDWAWFMKRLHDLGLTEAVCGVMQSPALHQDLALPLLEFQNLTKVLRRKWRDVKIDLERSEHRRALKSLHLASAPDRSHTNNGAFPKVDKSIKSGEAGGALGEAEGGGGEALAVAEGGEKRGIEADGEENGSGGNDVAADGQNGHKGSKRHNPEKWRRLGFETENPTLEFGSTGYLGMMDLTDYVRKNEDGFQKQLLEQSTIPLYERCPVARASLAVTLILYEHFEVDQSEAEDVKSSSSFHLGLDSESKNYDRLLRPLFLQWSRLHMAGLLAFFRLWNASSADGGDFSKVVDLIRVLVDHSVGQATRTKDVVEVEDEILELQLDRIRELQIDRIDRLFEDRWGVHLQQVRDELRQEALQFVKEQRVRCLLQGCWFARPPPRRDAVGSDNRDDRSPRSHAYRPWRYAKLSHNRRFLHYADFLDHGAVGQEPGLDVLVEKIDLGTISSVVSNVLAAPAASAAANGQVGGVGGKDFRRSFSVSTLRVQQQPPQSSTKITIFCYVDASTVPPTAASDGVNAGTGDAPNKANVDAKEQAILTLYPSSHSLASEWLDGMLMLLGQAPITAETNKLVNLVREYGLRIRLLNVRVGGACDGPPPGAGLVPSRDGLDDDYFYEI